MGIRIVDLMPEEWRRHYYATKYDYYKGRKDALTVKGDRADFTDVDWGFITSLGSEGRLRGSARKDFVEWVLTGKVPEGCRVPEGFFDEKRNTDPMLRLLTYL